MVFFLIHGFLSFHIFRKQQNRLVTSKSQSDSTPIFLGVYKNIAKNFHEVTDEKNFLKESFILVLIKIFLKKI